MKFVGVRKAQAGLSGLVRRAQKEKVVLTRHGQPIAVLTGLEGEDVEAALLAKDTGFQALLAERRRYRGPLVTHEEAKARLLPRKKRGVKEKREKGHAQG